MMSHRLLAGGASAAFLFSLTIQAVPAQTNTLRPDNDFVQAAMRSGEREVRDGRFAQKHAGSAAVRDFAIMLANEHAASATQLASLAQHKGIAYDPSAVLPATPGTPAGTASPQPNMSSSSGTSGMANTAASGTVPGNSDPLTSHTAPDAATAANGAQTNSATGTANAASASAPGSAKSGYGVGGPAMTDESWRNLTGDAFDKAFMQHEMDDHLQTIALFKNETANGRDADIKAYAAATLPTLYAHLNAAQRYLGIPVTPAGAAGRTN